MKTSISTISSIYPALKHTCTTIAMEYLIALPHNFTINSEAFMTIPVHYRAYDLQLSVISKIELVGLLGIVKQS